MTTETRRLSAPAGACSGLARRGRPVTPSPAARSAAPSPATRPLRSGSIEALRRQGPAAVAALLTDAPPEGSPQRERWERTLDTVCAQRDCAASGLYWYTDLDLARAEARRTGQADPLAAPPRPARRGRLVRQQPLLPHRALRRPRGVAGAARPVRPPLGLGATGAAAEHRLRRRPPAGGDDHRQQRPLRPRLARPRGGRPARASTGRGCSWLGCRAAADEALGLAGDRRRGVRSRPRSPSTRARMTAIAACLAQRDGGRSAAHLALTSGADGESPTARRGGGRWRDEQVWPSRGRSSPPCRWAIAAEQLAGVDWAGAGGPPPRRLGDWAKTAAASWSRNTAPPIAAEGAAEPWPGSRSWWARTRCATSTCCTPSCTPGWASPDDLGDPASTSWTSGYTPSCSSPPDSDPWLGLAVAGDLPGLGFCRHGVGPPSRRTIRAAGGTDRRRPAARAAVPSRRPDRGRSCARGRPRSGRRRGRR